MQILPSNHTQTQIPIFRLINKDTSTVKEASLLTIVTKKDLENSILINHCPKLEYQKY
jgi:hypothetical protein